MADDAKGARTRVHTPTVARVQWLPVRRVVSARAEEAGRDVLASMTGIAEGPATAAARGAATQRWAELEELVAEQLLSGELEARIVEGDGRERVASPDTDRQLFAEVAAWRAGDRAETRHRYGSNAQGEQRVIGRETVPLNVGWMNRLRIPGDWPASGAPAPTRWPWGDYSTPDLDALAAVVREHWQPWHQGGGEPPKNDVVAAALVTAGLSKTKADAAASMIRHPSVPVGARPQRAK